MEDWQYQPAKDANLTLPERALSLQRESGWIESVTHAAWWLCARNYLRFYHRLSVRGLENVPKQCPFVMVANHASHLDALVLGAPLPWKLRDRIFPIAAGDVFFEVPAISLFATAMMNCLPLWRKNCGPQALRELRNRLTDEPCAFILFPEGARTRDGKLLPFKPGLGMIVAGTNVPVVPCHLDGPFEALHADHKWPRPRKITLTIGKPIVFGQVKNRREGWEQVTATLRNAVVSLGPDRPAEEAKEAKPTD